MDQAVVVPENTPILIVDDEASIREVISLALTRAGYCCHTAMNGDNALAILADRPIDVVITDIRMPGINGVELLKRIKAEYQADVMVMTGFTEDYNYESIVTAGASDFIQKPISFRELLIRLRRVLRMRYLFLERDRIDGELKENVKTLEKYSLDLKIANGQLEFAYLDTINRLVIAAEYRDEETGDHILRISRYCAFIAEKCGLSDETVKRIRYAAPMHDVGKIGIPDKILLKQGRLTPDEFEIIKTHTTIGASILDGSSADVLKTAREIALNHHEWWNGHGYPNRLAGKAIPLTGRIVGIADAFDALTSNRPYKSPYPVDTAIDIIRSERETHFDPEMVDLFVAHIDDITRIRDEVGSQAPLSPGKLVWSQRDIDEGIDLKLRPVA